MEELIAKINEFTVDGSPGVGQLIELNDIAKKLKVSKSNLEKLIAEAVANNKNSAQIKTEETRVDPFSRESENTILENESLRSESIETSNQYDLDEARNSFELEMKLRQEEERSKLASNIPVYESPVFEQPEITFPELTVSFGNDKKEEEKDFYDMPELPEIKQDEELKSEFTTPSFDSKTFEMPEIHIPEPEVEIIEVVPENVYFEPEKEKLPKQELESDFSFTQDGVNVPTFEETLKRTEERTSKEDILKKIIEDNKAALEKAKQKAGASGNQQKENRTTHFDPTNTETVTLQQSNTSKIVGIVAIAASILPFSVIGIIAGAYGYNLANKYKSYIDQNPQLYGSTITNNVNLGLYLSIAGAVIGGIRFLSFLF